MKKILLYFIISVSLLFVFSCYKKPYDNINLKKALDLMSKSTNLVLLDVRTPEEYMGGSAPNSINIDVLNTDFKSKIDLLDKNKAQLFFLENSLKKSSSHRYFLGKSQAPYLLCLSLSFFLP